jgi:hypothetical protein
MKLESVSLLLENLKSLTDVHSEFFSLSERDFDFFITIRESSSSSLFSRGGVDDNAFRETVTRKCLSYLRSLVNLRGEDVRWEACVEKGFLNGDEGHHVHVLLKILKEDEDSRRKILEILKKGAESFFLPEARHLKFDVNIRKVHDVRGVVSYFCKKERSNEFKYFFRDKETQRSMASGMAQGG